MDAKHWKDLAENKVPTGGDCHLWLAWLDKEDPKLFKGILSKEEKLRAERLRSPQGANRSIVARGILRVLLGKYLSRDPGRIVFSYGPHGKPRLADDPGTGISFNVSHSENLGVFAIASSCEVGVDIEEVHPVSDLDETASIFLSPDELAEYKTLPAGEKLERFYTLWTFKEAILKAHGTGFAGPARDVFSKIREFDPNISVQDVMIKNRRLISFIPADGFRGALVCL